MKNKKATLTKKDIEKYWDMEFEILDYLEQKQAIIHTHNQLNFRKSSRNKLGLHYQIYLHKNTV